MMKNKTENLFSYSIYAMSVLIMANVAISPGLAQIGKEFSEVPDYLIQMLITLPALLMIPASLCLNWLVKRFRVKQVVIGSLIVFIVCGLLPTVTTNFWILLCLRALQGFSVGIISPLSSLLITTFFSGEQQFKTMGGRTSVESIGAVFMMIVGGYLADYGWKYTFLIYMIAIPVLLFVWKMMPDASMPKEDTDKKVHRTTKLESVIWLYVIISFLYMVFLHCFSTNIAMYLDAEQYGTASGSGMITSAYMVSGFVCGLIFPKLIKVFGHFTMHVGLLLSAVCF